MNNSPKTPGNSFVDCHNKDTNHPTQLPTIFHFLCEHTATASMVSDVTGIYQKHICRYKRDLDLSGQLWEVEKKYCEKTGFRAWYLTCDWRKAPNSFDTRLAFTF